MRKITWIEFSDRRRKEWAIGNEQIALVAYYGSEEVGSVYTLGGYSEERGYGQLWGSRIGNCDSLESAKKQLEHHFNLIMDGKDSFIWRN